MRPCGPVPDNLVPQVRIELTTYRLQGECSASELQGLKSIYLFNLVRLKSAFRLWTTQLIGSDPTLSTFFRMLLLQALALFHGF
jgi:hypothetical protein